MEPLTIGQLARKAQVHVETVRYYERRGLLPKPPRRRSGYRQYSPEEAARIQFIKRAQELGFTLNEVAELLALRVNPDSTCADVKAQAEAKMVDISAKIHTLQRMKRVLAKLTAACDGGAPTGECPILEALDTKGMNYANR